MFHLLPGIHLRSVANPANHERRTIRPLCLIDLALPRNIDPAITDLPNVFLYNLDDLAKIAQSNLAARQNEVVKGMDYIDKKSLRVMQNINRT